MGDDDCYIYLLGKVDAFTSYEYARKLTCTRTLN